MSAGGRAKPGAGERPVGRLIDARRTGGVDGVGDSDGPRAGGSDSARGRPDSALLSGDSAALLGRLVGWLTGPVTGDDGLSCGDGATGVVTGLPLTEPTMAKLANVRCVPSL
ncbi:hypothetical protein Bpla01_14310 [Burkholderia plantarii]|nr:hypothetical protein Bpla01_14310 [Burkholderia plantarii]